MKKSFRCYSKEELKKKFKYIISLSKIYFKLNFSINRELNKC